MGYVLFTANGTFNPSDYGLVPGDMLNVVCVGGGASGSVHWDRNSAIGNVGTASSFGSFVTAPGGTRQSSYSIQGAVNAGSRPGLSGVSLFGRSGLGPCGAPGWMPGVGLVEYPVPIFNLVTTQSDTVLGTYMWHGTCGPQVRLNTQSTKPALCNKSKACGGAGTAGHNGSICSGYAPGGYGYGAGGGGTVSNACGGNSGSVIEAAIKLTSLSSISVTVGIGGNGTTYSNAPWSGDGADGCVAVFW